MWSLPPFPSMMSSPLCPLSRSSPPAPLIVSSPLVPDWFLPNLRCAWPLRPLESDPFAEEAVTEKAMFGGLAFLLHGNMAVSASRNGGLLARIDPGDTDAALARPHASLMEMRGRTMDGWITVAPDGVKTEQDLASWVEQSLAFVKTLPPKA